MITVSQKTFIPTQTKEISIKVTFALLGSRLFLFLFFQVLIALITSSWDISEQYWLLSATLTNLVSIFILFLLYKTEKISYLNLFKISRLNFKKDIIIFIGITVLTVPIVYASSYFLSLLLWDDINIPTKLMFRTIEKGLVYILLIAFPITIAFAELATYFGYLMPKLKEQLRTKWLAVFLPILFLSIQHCTLPFIPDINFIIYRSLVFLPFAAIIGISIYYRPSLFIYFAVLHGIMDFGTVMMFVMEI